MQAIARARSRKRYVSRAFASQRPAEQCLNRIGNACIACDEVRYRIGDRHVDALSARRCSHNWGAERALGNSATICHELCRGLAASEALARIQQARA